MFFPKSDLKIVKSKKKVKKEKKNTHTLHETELSCISRCHKILPFVIELSRLFHVDIKRNLKHRRNLLNSISRNKRIAKNSFNHLKCCDVSLKRNNGGISIVNVDTLKRS